MSKNNDAKTSPKQDITQLPAGSTGVISPALLVECPELARLTTLQEALTALREHGKRKVEHRQAEAELAEDWEAFCADVAARGVQERLKVVVGTNQVCDGRHRRLAALERGLTGVPYEIVTREQATAIMESTLVGRQHLTKAMRAYAAVVLHPEVAMEPGKAGRPEKGKSATELPIISANDLAVKFGVSRPVMQQACELYRRFSKSKTLQKNHEWRIRAGYGLGAILAGLGGVKHEGKENGPDQNEARLENLAEPFVSLAHRLKGWSEWEQEQRDLALERMAHEMAKMEADALLALEAAVLDARQLQSEEE